MSTLNPQPKKRRKLLPDNLSSQDSSSSLPDLLLNPPMIDVIANSLPSEVTPLRTPLNESRYRRDTWSEGTPLYPSEEEEKRQDKSKEITVMLIFVNFVLLFCSRSSKKYATKKPFWKHYFLARNSSTHFTAPSQNGVKKKPFTPGNILYFPHFLLET